MDIWIRAKKGKVDEKKKKTSLKKIHETRYTMKILKRKNCKRWDFGDTNHLSKWPLKKHCMYCCTSVHFFLWPFGLIVADKVKAAGEQRPDLHPQPCSRKYLGDLSLFKKHVSHSGPSPFQRLTLAWKPRRLGEQAPQPLPRTVCAASLTLKRQPG